MSNKCITENKKLRQQKNEMKKNWQHVDPIITLIMKQSITQVALQMVKIDHISYLSHIQKLKNLLKTKYCNYVIGWNFLRKKLPLEIVREIIRFIPDYKSNILNYYTNSNSMLIFEMSNI